jgi:hypothetical protein
LRKKTLQLCEEYNNNISEIEMMTKLKCIECEETLNIREEIRWIFFFAYKKVIIKTHLTKETSFDAHLFEALLSFSLTLHLFAVQFSNNNSSSIFTKKKKKYSDDERRGV